MELNSPHLYPSTAVMLCPNTHWLFRNRMSDILETTTQNVSRKQGNHTKVSPHGAIKPVHLFVASRSFVVSGRGCSSSRPCPCRFAPQRQPRGRTAQGQSSTEGTRHADAHVACAFSALLLCVSASPRGHLPATVPVGAAGLARHCCCLLLTRMAQENNNDATTQTGRIHSGMQCAAIGGRAQTAISVFCAGSPCVSALVPGRGQLSGRGAGQTSRQGRRSTTTKRDEWNSTDREENETTRHKHAGATSVWCVVDTP
jgi:hypothetical protein